MNNLSAGAQHPWLPSQRSALRLAHGAELSSDSERRWTRVSANIFVSAVLSGARGPILRSPKPRTQGQAETKAPWWRKWISPGKAT